MSWSILASLVTLFAAGALCLPMDIVPVTDLMPPKIPGVPSTDLLPPEKESGPVTDWTPVANNGPTPVTDLMPPPLPEETNEKNVPAMLFVINVIAVKNSTAENSNDVLHNDVIEEVPSEVAVPLALFLLVIEDEDENHPVSLDDVASDLEKEGFAVEKVVKDGETRLVKVDLDTIEKTIRVSEGSNEFNNLIEHETEIKDSGRLTSVRRKRHICLHCKLEELKERLHNKHHGGYGGGGCNTCGGGGGGYYVQPVYQPVQVQPVYQPVQQPVYRPVQQPIYQQPPQQTYYPQPQGCNTCGGHGGGGYGNGGGNAYAQASAQASASSSSGGYGGYGR